MAEVAVNLKKRNRTSLSQSASSADSYVDYNGRIIVLSCCDVLLSSVDMV